MIRRINRRAARWTSFICFYAAAIVWTLVILVIWPFAAVREVFD